MLSFNLFVALIVTLSVPDHSIWSANQLHAVKVWKLFIRWTYFKTEKLFDTLNCFENNYTSEQKLFKNLTVFVFES